mgnify:CR=1 FL=1
MKHQLKVMAGIVTLCSWLCACIPMVDTRGHTTEAEDFKQIIIGQSRTDDVAAILGNPTTRSTFGEEIWYYINERKETYGMFAPEVADQNVTAIYFGADKTVASIEQYKKEDGKNVELVSKTTPTEGRHLTAVEQLLGNVGRFAAPGRQIDPRNLNR